MIIKSLGVPIALWLLLMGPAGCRTKKSEPDPRTVIRRFWGTDLPQEATNVFAYELHIFTPGFVCARFDLPTELLPGFFDGDGRLPGLDDLIPPGPDFERNASYLRREYGLTWWDLSEQKGVRCYGGVGDWPGEGGYWIYILNVAISELNESRTRVYLHYDSDWISGQKPTSRRSEDSSFPEPPGIPGPAY